MFPGVAGGDHLGPEARVLGEQQIEKAVGDLGAATPPIEEEPAVLDLGLGVPADAHHRVGALRQLQPGGVRLDVFVHRPRYVVVGVDVSDELGSGEPRNGGADEHALTLAVPHQAVGVEDLLHAGVAEGPGEARIALVHHHRAALCGMAVGGNRVAFHLEAVDGFPRAVGDQDDEAVVGYPRQHPRQHLDPLALAGNHDRHALLHLVEIRVRYELHHLALGEIDPLFGEPRIQLDDLLDAVDPHCSEALGEVRNLDSHAGPLRAEDAGRISPGPTLCHDSADSGRASAGSGGRRASRRGAAATAASPR